MAAFAEERFYHDFLGARLGAVGASRILDTTVPETVEVVERRAPDGRRLVFLLNCSGNSVAVPLPRPYEDVWHNETVRSEVRLKPWGVRVLRG
ncbi:MAG: hypothetical protein A3K19_32965 [Lentisphaerae bacterium RIFOXYB12_FULL_65_16]|nr:MAG: hypothetical protein A3K18_15240 [Lentisphaerae bacterium RIFOXYA12_64_32]OGV87047.1 MAG: hypothetical protein A3K19_32965 [Lentisphaerae bacterium RIFOXYB12_FULL_65_16]